ncbi:MAG: hypothetical protein HY295_04410 [Thaumarchaeota archaeon]|nr:hypothetical protein [Nitrososphaerota archaeon]
MRYVLFVVLTLLFANIIPVFAVYNEPTTREQEIFNKLLTEFEQLEVKKKDVSDTLKSFKKPLVNTFACQNTDTNELVVNVVKTRLAKFNETQAHEGGIITGGTYTWQCSVTSAQKKITMDCNNEIRLNPDVLTQDDGRDARIKRVENLLILYHELLHGQLMIDAIKSSEKWRHDVCNKQIDDSIDYSYADKDHKIINPLQTEFVSQLIEKEGGIMFVKEITPADTENGTFVRKIGNLNDFPEYIKIGIHVTLRGTNLANTSFSSSGSDIMLSGNLINKTQSGIAWFYVFGNPEEKPKIEKPQIPTWIKKNAGQWAENTISTDEFLKGIEYLIQLKIINLPDAEQHTGHKIPLWVKNNAKWWYEEKIDDKTFLNSIQYLISVGIISV